MRMTLTISSFLITIENDPQRLNFRTRKQPPPFQFVLRSSGPVPCAAEEGRRHRHRKPCMVPGSRVRKNIFPRELSGGPGFIS